MKIYQAFLILVTVLSSFGCEKEVTTPEKEQNPEVEIENSKDEPKASIPLNYEWSRSPFSLNKTKYTFTGDVKYGTHERNVFDLILPKTNKKMPLVIYLHGGGFTRGNKEDAYIHLDLIRAFLNEGIAFATINYRYLEHTEDGVRESLEDAQQFLQFIRYYASEFNIDKEKIACHGASAGAGAALWLATHDDLKDLGSDDLIQHESTRIKAAVALGTQSTYNIVRWEEVFEEYNFKLKKTKFDKQPLFNFYKINRLPQLYTPKLERYRAEVDMLGLMDAMDAPIYVKNKGQKVPPQQTLDLYHHPNHASILEARAKAVGLKHFVIDNRVDLQNDEGSVKFILEEFRK